MKQQQLRVSLVQTSLVWENPEENIRRLSPKLASLPACDLIVLPETFTTGFSMRGAGLGRRAGDLGLAFLLEQSKKLGTAICGSAFYEKEPGQLVNRMFFVEPSGKTHHYDKRHRFGMAGETEAYGAGNEKPVVIDYLGWRILLQVCYDLRFPVFSRNTSGPEGYDLAIYVANWPEPRMHHWSSLILARAIENQAFVIAVNRVGKDENQLNYVGGSTIVSPSGSILLSMGTEEEIAHEVLSLQDLREYREKFPFLADADKFTLFKS